MARVDYAGQVYGRLTAIKFHHKISNNAYYWEFACECGNTIITNLHDARRGRIQSCGCIKRKLTEEVAGFRRTYQTYKKQAEARNLEWLLDEKDAELLFKQHCYYCGDAPFNHRQRSYGTRYIDYVYSGIDRKDNSLGYTKDNCVPCCSVCNRMKLDHTEGMFLNHLNKILNHMEAKHGESALEIR